MLRAPSSGSKWGDPLPSTGHQGDPSQPKRFLQPCLLLLIAESPGHGYDLLDRLAAFGFERDPGGLYRTLRAMEREGLVESEWQLADAGPGRRTYIVTVAGLEHLKSAASALEDTVQILRLFLTRYGVVVTSSTIVAGS
jgi:PadR family transcriptional regulator